VREQMMEWVKEHYPEAFPNMRYRSVGEATAQSGERGFLGQPGEQSGKADPLRG